MRLILHVGSTKTGTTTIQHFFCRHYSALLKRGILYPVKGSHTPNHVLVAGGFLQQHQQLPHNSFYMDNFQRFQKSFSVFWQNLLDDIETYKPHTVVLSSETLFENFSTQSKLQLSSFLSEYFDEISVVAYIRSPASDYMSRIAQQVKTAKKMMPPHVRPIKSILEYYEKEFPGAIKVYPFERGQLKNGDVLQDFLVNNLPGETDLIVKGSQLKNIALPGSLLATVQKIRLSIQPEGKLPTIAVNALINYLIEKKLIGQKSSKLQTGMSLREEIKNFLESSAVDYKWLLDNYGVRFSDLDYSKIEDKKNPYMNFSLLEDICDLDGPATKELEDLHVPTNKLIRLLITVRFICKTQATGLYRAHLSQSWVGKINRRLSRLPKPI